MAKKKNQGPRAHIRAWGTIEGQPPNDVRDENIALPSARSTDILRGGALGTASWRATSSISRAADGKEGGSKTRTSSTKEIILRNSFNRPPAVAEFAAAYLSHALHLPDFVHSTSQNRSRRSGLHPARLRCSPFRDKKVVVEESCSLQNRPGER